MHIGIIKERKTLADRRTPLTPLKCKYIKDQFNIDVSVESSDIRCFTDDEYRSLGIDVVNDMSHCDVLFGVKEVPIDALIADKTYFFFSHTIKEQAYNRNLLKEILKKRIRLIDYETIKDENSKRLIGFGRYAGIVGAYNAFLTYGKKHDLFELKPAHQCESIQEVKLELEKVKLPNIKIVITGSGRVAKGAIEILNYINLIKVSPQDFLRNKYDYPVYAQLSSLDYYSYVGKKNNVEKIDFYKKPSLFKSDFLKFAQKASLFISCHYWNPQAPVLFTLKDIDSDDFLINTIADITCDIKGSLPTTIRPSTIEKPIYDINKSGIEVSLYSNNTISVMAVDNLPCELPKDSSADFSGEVIEHILPYLLRDDGRIENASITTKEGNLNKPFAYLSNYIS